MKKKEKYIRICSLAAFEVFAFITICLMVASKQYDRLLLAIATPLIILIPTIVEKLFNCKIFLPVYLYALFYAIGPALGQCYNLYYTVSWWDKFLHISGGVMFAFFGFFLFEKFVGKDRRKVVMTAIFGLCFSMAISVFWEFCEYGADTFLGMDMQDDVIIDHINSYLLDEEIGVAGTIENIEQVIVNGERLPVNGYIDIGLNDTMCDMILETVGAIVASIIYILCRGKFAVFELKDKSA